MFIILFRDHFSYILFEALTYIYFEVFSRQVIIKLIEFDRLTPINVCSCLNLLSWIVVTYWIQLLSYFKFIMILILWSLKTTLRNLYKLSYLILHVFDALLNATSWIQFIGLSQLSIFQAFFRESFRKSKITVQNYVFFSHWLNFIVFLTISEGRKITTWSSF